MRALGVLVFCALGVLVSCRFIGPVGSTDFLDAFRTRNNFRYQPFWGYRPAITSTLLPEQNPKEYAKETNNDNDNKKYFVSQEKLPWLQASMDCNEKGMILATPKTESEHIALVRFIESNNLIPKDQYSGYWIGGRRNSESDEFRWKLTQNEVEVYGWLPGEPNGFVGEDCLELKKDHYRLGWNNYYCHDTRRYICEKSSSDESFKSILPGRYSIPHEELMKEYNQEIRVQDSSENYILGDTTTTTESISIKDFESTTETFSQFTDASDELKTADLPTEESEQIKSHEEFNPSIKQYAELQLSGTDMDSIKLYDLGQYSYDQANMNQISEEKDNAPLDDSSDQKMSRQMLIKYWRDNGYIHDLPTQNDLDDAAEMQVQLKNNEQLTSTSDEHIEEVSQYFDSTTGVLMLLEPIEDSDDGAVDSDVTQIQPENGHLNVKNMDDSQYSFQHLEDLNDAPVDTGKKQTQPESNNQVDEIIVNAGSVNVHHKLTIIKPGDDIDGTIVEFDTPFDPESREEVDEENVENVEDNSHHIFQTHVPPIVLVLSDPKNYSMQTTVDLTKPESIENINDQNLQVRYEDRDFNNENVFYGDYYDDEWM